MDARKAHKPPVESKHARAPQRHDPNLGADDPLDENFDDEYETDWSDYHPHDYLEYLDELYEGDYEYEEHVHWEL